ncbi:hypothetical protein LCD36_04485 [Saccharopolyspora sp. 6T]|uniref:hypothetical protein n=1 Tax=Saccharopolyspora sp. 6T TaxID=2877238 RepID=UPI001CD24BFC|nr:hypothetical protein [Saccharopolyspora sp. 6T]MCA1185709.1 hypothetical protein [Saccharopolyspora sp. 6T]
MRTPRMRQRVVVVTPGGVVVDPVTGNPRPGPPTSTLAKAYLEQRNLYAQQEYQANQTSVSSDFIVLLPAGTDITSESEVIDEGGTRFAVVGQPAVRRARIHGGKPRYVAAWLRLVSDMQEAR